MSEAGMYNVNNEDAKKIVVGKFTIIRHTENSIWIQTDDGEGAEFGYKSFERCIQKFFDDNF